MTRYRVETAARGVPRMSAIHGSLGWSSAALLIGADSLAIVDTGGPGYRAMWDGWLARVGATRRDVATVYLTHCHWDHIGAFAWFPQARYVVGRTEIAWATSAAAVDPYLEPATVSALAASDSAVLVDAGDEIDGVRVVATPGHTPGHLSYDVDGEQESYLIVGDAIKNRSELDGGAFAITSDRAKSARSRRVILGYADRGHRLLLGHEGVFARGRSTGRGMAGADPGTWEQP